jgi:hypothetical protein
MATVGAATSHAQYYSNPYISPYPQFQTSYSPYLGLLNKRGGITTNYYGLVRPLQDQQANVEAVNRQALQNRQAIAQVEESGELVTGKAAGFMTHGSYFGGSSGKRQSYATVPITSSYAPTVPYTPRGLARPGR